MMLICDLAGAGRDSQPPVPTQRSSRIDILGLLTATALACTTLAGCTVRSDEPRLGGYNTSEGFDPRADELASSLLFSVGNIMAQRMRDGDLAATQPAVRAALDSDLDPTESTPRAIEGGYVRTVSLTEPSTKVFRLDLIKYSVASWTDGLSFGNGHGTARWGRACGTTTIDATHGAASARSTTTITECPPETPQRPAPRSPQP